MRDFSDQPVPKEVMENIIMAASTAPSGAHKEPWTFCLISNASLKSKLRALAEEEEKKSYGGRMSDEWLQDLAPLGTDWVKEFIDIAPWIVVIMKRAYELNEDGSKHNNYYVSESVGLAAGFLEPLESTSIHLIQSGIVRLLQLFPIDGINAADVDEFNAQMKEEFLFVRDFIVLHYHVTEREDTPFWRHCKTMDIPETLKHRIELFKKSGRIFQKNNDIFAENSWSQVMLGQGLLPENYHPIVNMMTDEELKSFLMIIRNSVNNLVDQLPSHQQFIDRYCKAPQI